MNDQGKQPPLDSDIERIQQLIEKLYRLKRQALTLKRNERAA